MNIKKYIPLKLKQKIKSFFSTTNMNGNLLSTKQKIFIALAADYGNLGDVAISYAQYVFLKENFPNVEIIDVPISQTLRNIREIKKHISSNDVITIIGGGNLTDKYQDIEDYRLLWLKSFPKNKIISFPQTLDFNTDKKGNKSLRTSFEIYNSHSRFTMFARESVSFERMNHLLISSPQICPDIVLSLDKSTPSVKRTKITCCIREDDESNLSQEQRVKLLNEIETSYSSVTFTDTHIGISNLSWQQRQQELDNIWAQFRSSRIIITDRLHGMIFSVITKTPCLVLINNNHKIAQTYKNWLSQLHHIRLVESYDLTNVMNTISSLMEIEESQITQPDLHKKYQYLAIAIKNES
jgi:pyruvyl transferase EpsI